MDEMIIARTSSIRHATDNHLALTVERCPKHSVKATTKGVSGSRKNLNGTLE